MRTALGERLDVIRLGCGRTAHPAAVAPVDELRREQVRRDPADGASLLAEDVEAGELRVALRVVAAPCHRTRAVSLRERRILGPPMSPFGKDHGTVLPVIFAAIVNQVFAVLLPVCLVIGAGAWLALRRQPIGAA
jgi:hypothetical protein